MLKFLRHDDVLLMYKRNNPYDLYFELVDIFIDYDFLGRPGTMIAKRNNDDKLPNGSHSMRVSFDSYKPFDHEGIVNFHYNLNNEFADNNIGKDNCLSINDVYKKCSLDMVIKLCEYLCAKDKLVFVYDKKYILESLELKSMHIDNALAFMTNRLD